MTTKKGENIIDIAPETTESYTKETQTFLSEHAGGVNNEEISIPVFDASMGTPQKGGLDVQMPVGTLMVIPRHDDDGYAIITILY